MKRCSHVPLLFTLVIVAVAIVMAGFPVTAGQGVALPPALSGLVPKGFVVDQYSPGSDPYGGMFGGAQIHAVREVKGREFTSATAGHLRITVYDTSKPTWPMISNHFTAQLQAGFPELRREFDPPSKSDSRTVEAMKELAFNWGKGFCQATTYHILDPINNKVKNETYYICIYTGRVGGCIFELRLELLPDSHADGDQWAQTIAQMAGKLTVSSF